MAEFCLIISEYWKTITISVISENLSPIYQKVSEKFSLKNPKIYEECMSSLTFCHSAILQFLIAAIFFVTDGKELKLAQTAEINQLPFWFLNLIGPSQRDLNDKSRNLHKKGKPWRILVVVVNDVIVQIAYWLYWYIRLSLLWVNSYAYEQKCKQWRHDESAL